MIVWINDLKIEWRGQDGATISACFSNNLCHQISHQRTPTKTIERYCVYVSVAAHVCVCVCGGEREGRGILNIRVAVKASGLFQIPGKADVLIPNDVHEAVQGNIDSVSQQG